MDLTKLFETQKELRKVIYDRFPDLKERNNLDWLVLALQVELGELANEHRGFKMWSEDREPRTYKLRPVKPGRKCYYNPLLEEYADCLSFILEIGLEIGIDITVQEVTCDYTEETAIGTFNRMFRAVAELNDIEPYTFPRVKHGIFHELINLFIGLGEKHLGFTTDQIEQAYYDKNKINFERQANGY